MRDAILEKLPILLPNAKVELLELLIEQSMDNFMAICCIDEVPEKAQSVIVQMVLWHYNQRGAEGLNSQSYSGMNESYAADYPAPLKRSIHRFRGLKTL